MNFKRIITKNHAEFEQRWKDTNFSLISVVIFIIPNHNLEESLHLVIKMDGKKNVTKTKKIQICITFLQSNDGEISFIGKPENYVRTQCDRSYLHES